MDSYREHPSDYDATMSDAPPSDDIAAAIGTDERRMHVRAYNYWVSLLDGRDFPSIEDLEPGEVLDFASNSVLLDFTCGRDNPAVPYIGGSIRDECGLDDSMRTINDVPSRSLLSRLTDHYLQIIANRAPIGFEAEYENMAGETICYRGILMPFSSDGEQIDFIYGVINWKLVDGETDEAPTAAMPVVELSQDGEVENASEIESEPQFQAEADFEGESEFEAGPVAESDPVPAPEAVLSVEPEIEPELVAAGAPETFAREEFQPSEDEEPLELTECSHPRRPSRNSRL